MDRSSPRYREGFQRLCHLEAQGGVWWALDEKVPAKSAAEAGERGRGGSIDLEGDRRLPEDLLIQMGDASVAAVRSALAAPSWETVRRLFPLLPRLPAPDAAEILKRLFRHYNPRIRLESVRLVGQMGAEFTDEPLLDALGDTDASVRQGAMAVLGGLRVKAAIPALRQIAEEPPGTRDVEGQMAAIAALGAIGDPEALSTLIALLHRKRWLLRRTTEKIRIAAAYALGIPAG